MKLESLKSEKFTALSKNQMSLVDGGDWSKTTPTGHYSAGYYEDWSYRHGDREVCREYYAYDGSVKVLHF